MQGYSTIYTDGASQHVSAGAAEVLRRRGLVMPHPGAGEDGILGCDWKLTEGTGWADVYALVGEDGDLTREGAIAAGHLAPIDSRHRRGLSDMRRDLGRAPTAEEWADERR